jgi:hypothetical protein
MTNCQQKGVCASTKKRRTYSWIPAVLVAILPKCPFCIMAYSGAVTMCSGNMLFPNAGTTASYLTVGLAALVIFGILLNRKGRKTWVALALASTGILFLIIGQFYFISMISYYLGVLLLFFGIWLNGSLPYFYRKYVPGFKKHNNQITI